MKQLLSTPVSVDAREVSDEIYLEIETLRLSNEVVGGWSNIKSFGMAVAVTWDARNNYRTWLEPRAVDLITELHNFGRIVTFNGRVAHPFHLTTIGVPHPSPLGEGAPR